MFVTVGRLPGPPLFEEIRQRLKTDAKRDDIVVLVAWLLTHFTDDGLLRSPQATRRTTIVLSGTGLGNYLSLISGQAVTKDNQDDCTNLAPGVGSN